MHSNLAFVLLAAMLAGCVAQPQPRLVSFDAAEYEPFTRPGTGIVEGQAFLVQRGGAVVKGAGREVSIHPVSAYSTETYERWFVGGQPLSGGDWHAHDYTKTTVADGDGRFRFEDLAAGDYYIHCTINWEYAPGNVTGGIAYSRIHVENGQTTKAVVTRPTQ